MIAHCRIIGYENKIDGCCLVLIFIGVTGLTYGLLTLRNTGNS